MAMVSEHDERVSTVSQVAITVVAYLVALVYAESLGPLTETWGLIWPPAGVAVASLLLTSRRRWAPLLAALFVTQVVYDLVVWEAALLPAVLWSLANFTAYLLVPALVVRWQAASLDTVGRVLRFTLAALLGAAPAGLLGAMGAVLSGSEVPYAITAALWATGTVVAILMLVPLAMLVFGRLPAIERAPVEVAAILTAVLVVSLAVFALGDHLLAATLDYVVLLPIVWAALRLRLPGAVIAIAISTNVAILGTVLGRGPFAAAEWTAIESAALVRVFLFVVPVTALLIASRAQEGVSSAGLAEQREQLLAAVSHELRTPLTPVVGFSQLLLERRDDLDPEARNWIRSIERNGRYLTSLIDDLLLLSRAGRGRLGVEPERLDFGDVVTEILEDHPRPEIMAGRIDPEVRVTADPQHVRQILDNLLQNALRHGRPPVLVDVERVDSAARLVVTDGGVGVPEELVDQLFSPFAQPTTGDRRGTEGLGLGLAICAELAQANGGSISYDGGAESGARFEVRLPLAAEGGEEQRDESHAEQRHDRDAELRAR